MLKFLDNGVVQLDECILGIISVSGSHVCFVPSNTYSFSSEIFNAINNRMQEISTSLKEKE